MEAIYFVMILHMRRPTVIFLVMTGNYAVSRHLKCSQNVQKIIMEAINFVMECHGISLPYFC